MQTPSGHCRCKKTQTPSRHGPKTAQTASQKTVSRYLWNPHKTIFGATEHMPSLCKHHLEPHKTTLEPQSTCPDATPSGHCRCKKTQTPSRHEPKTAQTASQKTVSRYLWNPHKTIFGATEHMPSLCKHHLDTADAKRPKHHLDTSRKPPKPQAKKLFHVTFGIHIKQSLEPQSTCPAYANTIWNHIKQLWSHRSHAQPMQTPSGHCRCKKTQTPSRHEPKTAQTASQKTVSRYLWNPHKTIFGATEHMQTSLCKHHLDTADAKRPKHHLDTSRKPPKPQAKKLFHVTFGIHIKQSLEPQSTSPAYANTSLCKHHLDTADAHQGPKHQSGATETRAEHRPNRKPKNTITLPLEST